MLFKNGDRFGVRQFHLADFRVGVDPNHCQSWFPVELKVEIGKGPVGFEIVAGADPAQSQSKRSRRVRRLDLAGS